MALIISIIALVFRSRQQKKSKYVFEETNLDALKWQIDFKGGTNILRTQAVEIEKKHELGKGAFGVVFAGRWRNADVAVKQLLSSGKGAIIVNGAENNVTSTEFLQEAENMM